MLSTDLIAQEIGDGGDPNNTHRQTHKLEYVRGGLGQRKKDIHKARVSDRSTRAKSIVIQRYIIEQTFSLHKVHVHKFLGFMDAMLLEAAFIH